MVAFVSVDSFMICMIVWLYDCMIVCLYDIMIVYFYFSNSHIEQNCRILSKFK